jgi:error-prone DNA polymerase
MTAPYIELHAHSAFSFLDGASTPVELASRAAQLDYPAFALTDHDGVWGSMEFAHACKGVGVQPITGAEISIAGGDGHSDAMPAHLTLLAETQAGYQNLCRLLTAAHAHTREGAQRSATQPWVRLESVEAHAEGLICLSGCAHDGMLAGAWELKETPRATKVAQRLLSAFGRDHFRIELQRPYWRHDNARNRWLAGLAERLRVPTVATGNVHAHSVRRTRLQDVLVAVSLGQMLESCEGQRRGNRSSALVSPAAMAARFPEHPAAVAETVELGERLRFDLTEQLGYRYPGSDDLDADRKLATITEELLIERYDGSSDRPEAERRLREELGVIRHLGLSGFFLLHRDLLELAREVAVEVRGRASVRAVLPPGRGRGSSVSSIVCYLTGLSHIDPVKAQLFAGRFLNEETTSLPDIDIDFPRDIREVLIPRVHERYGAEHSALVAAFPTYRPKGAVRDLGKALGLWPDEIEKVARTLGFHSEPREMEAHVVAAIGAKRARTNGWKALLWLAPDIMGLPRHPSQHPGGMVISTRPLIDLCPVVPAAMEGRQILQWDKDSCADAGLLKIDLLGLGMLSAVERAVVEIERVRGKSIDLSRIPLDDEETFESIRAARTTGVFQIESRAQMQMLPRTQPRDLDDLTVQVALVRPGPIQGGAIHPYIERRKALREDPNFEVPYPHPLLKPVLEETLGTIVFQEQVIEVAMALSGFSSSEAEGLRRAMSRKRSQAAIDAYCERLIAGAQERGVPARIAETVWSQIEGFSGFGFPKAHSAAFGLLAYQSAWLRVHYAPEFLCALLNEQPMGFYPPDSLIHEARRRGATVAPPAVNQSDVLCRVEREAGGLVVRIGLGYVKGVHEEEMTRLSVERERGGRYRGIADLASRSGVGRDGLERLAWAGALDDLPVGKPGEQGHRRDRYWQLGIAGTSRTRGKATQLALPMEPPTTPALEALDSWELAVENYRATGINLGEHPLALLRPSLGGGVLPSYALGKVADGATVEVAGMVVARQRPETAEGITFMLLEDEHGTINLILGVAVYERSRTIVRSAPLVRARGRLERREGAVNLIVDQLTDLEGEPRGNSGDAPDKLSELERRRAQRRVREQAVAQLRAVAPTGHSFGRWGR